MKIVDVNLLVYAGHEKTPHHKAARRWLEGALSSTESIGFAWLVVIGFIRVTTNPRAFASPLSPEEALDVVDLWLSQPPSITINPTDRHAAILRDLLSPLGTGGNLTADAHLAALSIEHGAQVCSSDNDFGRFPGINWLDPLRT